MRLVGLRVGPNKVRIIGILQPLGDAGKLANKQVNMLSNFSFFFYYIRSVFLILSSFFLWLFIYADPSVVFFRYSFLGLMIILAFNSLNSIIRGWRSFSKFSLIGSLRTVSQLVSYEAVIYLCFLIIFYLYTRFNICDFYFSVLDYLILLIPFCFYIWVPSLLADLNRTPFDFSEGERELVSGFNTEFGSFCFTLVFLSEYMNIVFFCLFTSYLFFSGYLFFFILSIFFIVWIRGVLPRFRFDKLIILAWKFFVPFLTLIFCLCLFFFF